MPRAISPRNSASCEAIGSLSTVIALTIASQQARLFFAQRVITGDGRGGDGAHAWVHARQASVIESVGQPEVAHHDRENF